MYVGGVWASRNACSDDSGVGAARPVRLSRFVSVGSARGATASWNKRICQYLIRSRRLAREVGCRGVGRLGGGQVELARPPELVSSSTSSDQMAFTATRLHKLIARLGANDLRAC